MWQQTKRGEAQKEEAGYIYAERKMTRFYMDAQLIAVSIDAHPAVGADSSLVIDLCRGLFFPEKQRQKQTNRQEHQTNLSRVDNCEEKWLK